MSATASFEVHGATLAECEQKARVQAALFFGDTPFNIGSVNARPLFQMMTSESVKVWRVEFEAVTAARAWEDPS